MADLERRRLVGGALRLGDADRAHGRGVDDALDPGLERLLEDDPRAAQVGREDRLAVGGAQRGAPGDVKDPIDPLHRPAHRAAVGDVAGRPLELEPVEMVEVRSCGARAGAARRRARRAREPGASRESRCAPVTRVLAIGAHATADRSRGCDLIRTRAWARTPTPRWSPTRTAYLPDELVAEHGIHRVSLYVTLDGEQRRESEISADEYDDFYERLRRSDEGATTSQPSVGDFTGDLRAAARRRDARSSRSTSPPGSRAPTTRRCRRARQLIDSGAGGERIHVWDSRSGCGGQGLMALVAARAAAAGASGDEALERGRARARHAEDVVRDRHARVPAQGRADRRRPGVARLGASDQADPDARGGDHPGRAGAHPPARVRAHGRVRPRAQGRRRRRLGRAAHPRPRHRPRAWSTSAARSSAPTRSSSPRSAR